MSESNHGKDFLIFAALTILGVFMSAYFFINNYECSRLNGTLVAGVFKLVCVKELRDDRHK